MVYVICREDWAVCVCDNTLHGVICVMTDGIRNMSGRLGSVCL